MNVWGWYGLDWRFVGILAAIGWFVPWLGSRWFAKIEAFCSRLAARRRLSIVVLFALPIFIRLSLLPVIPVQPPRIHDEFSYLLAADTFAHGRLANPAHPMWAYLDTFHVLQHPTYASKYPPAQGAALAVGQLLGHPWIGVLLSVGAMCAGFLWMLQGWVPPRWAFLGAILVMGHFAILSYWMNAYWGGAVPALGAALVLGALPRILRKPRPRHATVMALGVIVLANSRPLEGLIFCLPVAMVLLVRLVRQRGAALSVMLRRCVLPAAAVFVAGLAFTLYYNWRVTGEPLLFPHVLDARTHESVGLFMWQQPKAPMKYSNRQFDVFYNVFERTTARQARERPVEVSMDKLRWSYEFFLGPALALPFLALWPLLRNRRTRFLVFQLLFCVAGALAVVWFQPHYLAPAMAVLFVILIRALRYMRKWRFEGRPVGLGLTRAVVITALLMPIESASGPMNPGWQRVVRQLQDLPGNQLAIMRYSPTRHSIHDEWVYNGADIDGAKIVWAREIPGMSLQPLLDYFKDRNVWIVEPEANPLRVKPYDIPVSSASK